MLDQRRLPPAPADRRPTSLRELVDSALNIVGLTEQLLEETLFQLREIRPIVTAAGEAYRAGQLTPLLRTINQVQSGANAIAVVVWTPIDVVRGVITTESPEPRREALEAATEWVGPARWVIERSDGVVDSVETLPGGAVVRWLRDRVLGAPTVVAIPENPVEPVRGLGGFAVWFRPLEVILPAVPLLTKATSVRLPGLAVAVPIIGVLRLPKRVRGPFAA